MEGISLLSSLPHAVPFRYHTKRFIEHFKREQATIFFDSTISQTFNNYITIALKGNTQIVNARIA